MTKRGHSLLFLQQGAAQQIARSVYALDFESTREDLCMAVIHLLSGILPALRAALPRLEEHLD